jgi:hypothetical protein
MPLLLLSRHVPVVPAATTVGGGIASGAEIAGSIGGVVGALVAVAGLFIAIAGNNAKRRREYDREIREAEERGEERFRPDMEFWRGIAMSQLGHSAVPVPPSQQHHRPPRPLPDDGED